jgi:hypothetical protein
MPVGFHLCPDLVGRNHEHGRVSFKAISSGNRIADACGVTSSKLPVIRWAFSELNAFV